MPLEKSFVSGHTLKEISPTTDLYLTTNLKNPIRITGVAECHMRESRDQPYRKGHLAFYEKNGISHKAEINQDLYDALYFVFTSIGILDFKKDSPDEYFGSFPEVDTTDCILPTDRKDIEEKK